MHSRTGYSGSPVFVYRTSNTNLDAIFKDRVEAGSPGDIFIYLLGIHCGQFPEDYRD
jgi:hypothetical protein